LASTTFYAIIATYFSPVLWCPEPCAAGESIGAINTRKQRKRSPISSTETGLLMNTKRSFCLGLALACSVVGVVHAQKTEDQPSKQQSNIKASRPYLLGPGDVIEIKVFGQPDLSSTAQVDSDGNLSSLPFLDPIPAKCRVEKDVQKDIAVAYSRLVKEPQVSVRITGRNSRTPASISGAVRQTTRVSMERQQRLNEVVAAAGGFSDRASGTIQILHTEPVMCPDSGDEADRMPIDGSAIPFQVVKISV
jgi:polysaccharide export outer membrane protein